MKTKIVIIVQLSLSALCISAVTTAALKDAKPTQLKAKNLQAEMRSELKQLNAVSLVPTESKMGLASLQLSSNQSADWLIIGADNRSYKINSRSRLHKSLPAGHYTVRASFRDIALHKKIHLQPGQSLKSELDIPTGQVRLIATKNNQPLFKAVAWDIYRIIKGGEERRLIGQYHLHSRSISMPPGHYEAVAKHKNINGKRQFRVQEGNTNDVILALN